MSDQFWIYWALTIPITMAVVAVWVFWDRRRERRYDREDADLEVGVEAMERLIMSNMRKRTMSKVSTWGQGGEIVKEKIVVKG